MNKIRHSLSAKLSLGILLMAAPIFVLALGILFLQTRHFIRQEAVKHANSVLNTTLQHVRKYMSTVETATNANTWLVEEYFHPDSLLSVSRRIVQFNSNVNGCSITTEPNMFPQCGRYFSAYTVRENDTIVTVRESEYEYYDKTWYKAPLQAGKAVWVEPFDDYNKGTLYSTELITSYCKPFHLKDGRLGGVIATDLSLHQLAETINNAEHPYPNAYFILIGSDGRYFVHPDTTRLFRKTIFSDADLNKQSDMIALGHEMTAGKRGSTSMVLGGRLCHISYAPVQGTDWSMALICPDSDVLHSYHQQAYIIAVLIVTGLLVILLFCKRIVAYTIKPLSHLLDITQRMASGNYDELIPHTDRKDAVGRLQNSFATMQQSINFHLGGINHATEETRQRNEELVHATQMAEEATRQKTVFIQNVTHQIRTPLNIVIGFAQVLRDSLETKTDNTDSQYALQDEEMADITKTIKHNASHLNRMVLMLYDSSDTGISQELQAHADENILCNEIARKCINYTKTYFPDIPVHLETELPDNLCIRSNSLYLMRTIRELLYNAAKYADGKLTLRVTQTADTVRYIVEDVGPGIPEATQEAIFKSFAKADDLSEGLGLGLPLAKRHAISLGGDLTLDNSYHNGCRFIVEIPKNKKKQ